MNSGRIFTEPRSGEVNILLLFTEIEKNNCFSIYTRSDIKTDNLDIFKGNLWKAILLTSNLTSQFMRETRRKLFTDSFNMANSQSSIKSSSEWSFNTVQIGNFNRKSAWKSITDQTKFSKLSTKACCLARCEGACQWGSNWDECCLVVIWPALFSRGDIKLQFFFFSISSISMRNSFCQANQSTKILVMRQIVVVKINCCLFSDRSNWSQ